LNDSVNFAAAAMSERFYVEPAIQSPRVTLAGDEARHLAAVMRAQPDDEVTLFDGSGVEFTCRVVQVGKRESELEVVERREVSRELPFRLTLAVALPKGERQKWLVEKLTELGVTRLVPLVTERGVAQPTAAALDRLRRGVIEASKQCGRNRLMEIGEPVGAEFFSESLSSAIRIVADPAGMDLSSVMPKGAAGGNAGSISNASDWLAAVGPEGGFTATELAAASAAGWQLVTLGPRILRVETAAIALAARAALSREHP
jgi:16S rRNA (uracil1498-N3)-methyltransferase